MFRKILSFFTQCGYVFFLKIITIFIKLTISYCFSKQKFTMLWIFLTEQEIRNYYFEKKKNIKLKNTQRLRYKTNQFFFFFQRKTEKGETQKVLLSQNILVTIFLIFFRFFFQKKKKTRQWSLLLLSRAQGAFGTLEQQRRRYWMEEFVQ